ncbi:hypothetical protein ETU10_07540 [Apibacter muscae]|uniref:hypothetical protein n=1 Tax=Apibacter muscae TaxID=2509004 RepID=UPI0011AB8F31|nr:hypothetical protein [Apibacter muscae]TWP23567.1 hypothetical protein ETU10_07540 [Apibacter muscae]
MESTQEQPVAFFEYFIVNGGLKNSKQKYIQDFIENSGFHVTNIDKEKGIVSFFYIDEEGCYIEESYNYALELNKILRKEFYKSKKLIDQAVLDSNLLLDKTKADNYFLLIQKTLQYIIDKGGDEINQFPILLKPIKGIYNYINEKYRNDTNITLQFPEVIISEMEDEALVYKILGYLKGLNNNREKIMSDEQFALMISYVMYFIENEENSTNFQKLQSIKISKNLLRFTFWVLHKHLYTTSKIKDNFLHFIKDMFIDFDTWEFSTFKTKFGNKDKVTIHGLKFIPEIIKSEFKKSS